MKNRIKISVDGKSFTLVGEETEAHMQAVAACIHKKIEEIRTSAAAVKLDTSLAYVLTALNVADDYFKEKDKNAELEGRNLGLSTRLEELISQLEETKAELDEVKAERDELKEIQELTEDRPPKAEAENHAVLYPEGKQPAPNNKEETVSHDEGEPQNLHPVDSKSTDSNPMGLKGGQTGKNIARKGKRNKYRRK
ncbi:MAG: cell division protein ZapA [Anaerotignum sp.]|nr:cell division protein ZapA [Anaerotignum sp.]